MTFLSKDAIFASEDRRYAIVDVSEWGGSVRIRSLTGRERDEFEAGSTEMKNGRAKPKYENFRARYCAQCIVDENDHQMFVTRSEIAMLGNKSVAALQKIFNKCQELNGMSDEDVEELTEGFDRAGSEDTTSGSPLH